MNKKLLDKLKFQAAAQVSPLLEGSEWQQVYSEKFAELIVRECAKVLDTWNKENGAEEGHDKEGLISLWSSHFGVEE